MFVPAARLEVVNSATPLTSVALPIAPPWSLNVTVPPFGVAPPGNRSLTVAVNVTDWPMAAERSMPSSAVRVGRRRSVWLDVDRQRTAIVAIITRKPLGVGESANSRRTPGKDWSHLLAR